MRFSKEHCWVNKTDSGVFIGITHRAAEKICKNFELFLCDEGDFIRAGESLGEIISCEFFDIISPVSGKVVWVNDEILNNPAPLRERPFEYPLCKMTDVAFTLPLMSETEYLK